MINRIDSRLNLSFLTTSKSVFHICFSISYVIIPPTVSSAASPIGPSKTSPTTPVQARLPYHASDATLRPNHLLTRKRT